MNRHETWGWIAVVAASIVVLATGSHIAILFLGLDSSQNQAVAAWVQAIGSVVAIAGSYHLGRKQTSQAAFLQKEAENRAGQRKCETFLAVAKAAVDRAQWADETLFFPGFRVNPPPFVFGGAGAVALRVEEARRAMTAVPLHELGDAASVIAWSDLTLALADVLSTIDSAQRAYAGASVFAEDFDAGPHPGGMKLALGNVAGAYSRLANSIGVSGTEVVHG
ncbi:hypothetical protein K6V90_25800 [Cupriavidus pauculus]|uniref:hypothetical protein n=1 Tax=Cupriavidus pauculus TaxID=82633 RepID=UPI001C9332E4|nr:hypothetical protein [Cupriavidus pauculus]MBY4733958.1 hypothetical protein [Cupriavidus pauculus]